MTRERWAMVLLVALVFGCLVVALNATPKAQTLGTTPVYEMEVVPVPDQYPFVVVLNRHTGAVSLWRPEGGGFAAAWIDLGDPAGI